MSTSKKKNVEKKVSLGNAIIIGAVLAIGGFVAGMFAPGWINKMARILVVVRS